jgi:hypothetical protein
MDVASKFCPDNFNAVRQVEDGAGNVPATKIDKLMTFSLLGSFRLEHPTRRVTGFKASIGLRVGIHGVIFINNSK